MRPELADLRPESVLICPLSLSKGSYSLITRRYGWVVRHVG